MKDTRDFVIFAGNPRLFMEQKKPMELDLRLVENQILVRHNEFRFITPEFGFVRSFAKLEPELLRIGQPYRIKEGRIAFVKQGMARISINLMECTFKPGILALIAPNSLLQILEVSPDFDTQMVGAETSFLPIGLKEDLFNYFLQQKRNNIMLTLTPEESKQIEDILAIIWNILQESIFRKKVIQHLLASLLYNIEYISLKNHQNDTKLLTRQEDLFQRFISLVNNYSKTERNVGFYADKLCLTPRYLNTVIREVSQQTVMNWINQSIILEAKVLLKHSNHLVYQISDELNFPNPSFFCKFFKRMTGMSPQEYQRK